MARRLQKKFVFLVFEDTLYKCAGLRGYDLSLWLGMGVILYTLGQGVLQHGLKDFFIFFLFFFSEE